MSLVVLWSAGLSEILEQDPVSFVFSRDHISIVPQDLRAEVQTLQRVAGAYVLNYRAIPKREVVKASSGGRDMVSAESTLNSRHLEDYMSPASRNDALLAISIALGLSALVGRRLEALGETAGFRAYLSGSRDFGSDLAPWAHVFRFHLARDDLNWSDEVSLEHRLDQYEMIWSLSGA